MLLGNAKGGWAQTSPPLAFWSFPIVLPQQGVLFGGPPSADGLRP